ncbi:HNH endonuclease signature motif containing protein [Gordonia rubripertincta]|uniref:DUF222 domain-containing protein n=1 Tax=Gordonia rubripertincta TaxID=36822 RepID=A0ABT4N1S9_GORRU|nr:HNH endonuclease signature motif containing protein [Gordonia rubripertincta]MCZ4553228.1 DUF222 domain-containing protein [Gordonia rubripertincta]
MSDGVVIDSAVVGAVSELDAAIARLSELDLTALSDVDCVRVVERLEVASRRLQSASLPVLREVAVRRAYSKVGCSSPAAVLTSVARLRPGAAKARVQAMEALTSSVTPSGEVIEPRFPETAALLAEGVIDLDHVGAVVKVMGKIPHKIDPEQRANTEVALADLCRRYNPAAVETIGERIVDYLDPDGKLADDVDRAKKRGVSVGDQAVDMMAKVAGHLDPTTTALMKVMLGVWAAPGMNNPDDELSPSGAADDPALDPAVLQAAADNDLRTQSQRNHDALKAMLLYLLESGQLGKTHRGLPVQVIINMTKDELDEALREQEAAAAAAAADDVHEPEPELEPAPEPEPGPAPEPEPERAYPDRQTQWKDPMWLPTLTGGPMRPYGKGVVYTATGTVLPISDAIKLLARSDKTLAVFANHSNEVLYLGRAKRLASEAQRIAMFAAHRGCSFGGCTNPAMWAEAHHTVEWAQGGLTDITHLAPACPQHHKLVGPGEHQWQTIMITEGPDAGRCAWIPPAFLDPERRPRVNRAHHPDEALIEAREAMLARRKAQLEQGNRELSGQPPDTPTTHADGG